MKRIVIIIILMVSCGQETMDMPDHVGPFGLEFYNHTELIPNWEEVDFILEELVRTESVATSHLSGHTFRLMTPKSDTTHGSSATFGNACASRTELPHMLLHLLLMDDTHELSSWDSYSSLGLTIGVDGAVSRRAGMQFCGFPDQPAEPGYFDSWADIVQRNYQW